MRAINKLNVKSILITITKNKENPSGKNVMLSDGKRRELTPIARGQCSLAQRTTTREIAALPANPSSASTSGSCERRHERQKTRGPMCNGPYCHPKGPAAQQCS
jgi:hypothetical protein